MAHSRNVLKIMMALACLASISPAQAVQRIVGNTTITVLTQSVLVSNAHLVQATTAGMFVGCANNRAYIDVADRELLAAALTAQATGRAVAVAYDDNAASSVAPPHGGSTCKIKSLW